MENREFYNKKCLEFMLSYFFKYEYSHLIAYIKDKISKYPSLRFGQIISNYLSSSDNVLSTETIGYLMMGLFPGKGDNYDPFYEEPSETFKHLKKYYKCLNNDKTDKTDINDNKEISNIDKINDILKQFDNICIFNNIDKLNENIRKELKEKVINKLIALIPIK